jgi:hypothetical protein
MLPFPFTQAHGPLAPGFRTTLDCSRIVYQRFIGL